MIITVLFYIFVAVTSIQIIYYLSFSIFAFHSDVKKEVSDSKPVSVIICAKNEAENLTKFLPSIINQKYPNFEIILINDVSSDNTLNVMNAFRSKNSIIKIIIFRISQV